LKKKQLIQSPHHAVLESAHPSPLSASRGFFGCRHFSQINEIIKESGHPEIDWSQTSE
jgi:uracil-DNA glycosylase